jgi:phosphatidylserine/phosphatidylglycerophosphate/cardiolipin synthase-like enzyme
VALAGDVHARDEARAAREGMPVVATGTLEALFTPGDRIDDAIIAAIGEARSEILVNAYSFTHRRIAQALIAAHARGVRVAVIADREQARALPQNVLVTLADAGVDVVLDGTFPAAHNKVMVIDAMSEHAITFTGSFNFTIAAQRSNAENMLVMRDNPAIARAYRANWERLRAHAERGERSETHTGIPLRK